jgi:hypothetical protein
MSYPAFAFVTHPYFRLLVTGNPTSSAARNSGQ